MESKKPEVFISVKHVGYELATLFRFPVFLSASRISQKVVDRFE